jgi:hypothetical protein
MSLGIKDESGIPVIHNVICSLARSNSGKAIVATKSRWAL